MPTANGVNGLLKENHSSHLIDRPKGQSKPKDTPGAETSLRKKRMESLLQEVEDAFGRQLDLDALLRHSHNLQLQLRQHLQASEQCMLPSFNYNLPTGQEQGLYLALEVGGSNLRIAMVELAGRHLGLESMSIIGIETCPINFGVKQLPGHGFFDWMAERVRDMLQRENKHVGGETDKTSLHMGVAWSFPIEQTSIRSGIVLGMGKGFLCSDSIKGRDLGDVIQQGFNRAKLHVCLDAIVNDSSSALLARAYLDPATRLAFILGTGVNAAIHIPLDSLAPSKFLARFADTVEKPRHVLTNTEFSMFGKNIFPTTRWDEALNAAHIMPDYQPLEYLIAGVYISELVRLVLADATATCNLWGGRLPPSLQAPYTLDSKTLAVLETDASPLKQNARTFLTTTYPSSSPPPSTDDLTFLLHTIHIIIRRSIAFFAAGVHALTSLIDALDREAGLPSHEDHFSIGCDGSIINKYPAYMERAQQIIDALKEHEEKKTASPSSTSSHPQQQQQQQQQQTIKNTPTTRRKKRVILEKTKQSAVLGAGIAAALAREYGGRAGESGSSSPQKGDGLKDAGGAGA